MRNKGYSDYEEERMSKVLYLEHLRQRQAMLDLAETLDTPHELRVLLYLRNIRRPFSLGDISYKCRLQEQDVRTILAILVRKGLVRRVDNGLFVSP